MNPVGFASFKSESAATRSARTSAITGDASSESGHSFENVFCKASKKQLRIHKEGLSTCSCFPVSLHCFLKTSARPLSMRCFVACSRDVATKNCWTNPAFKARSVNEADGCICNCCASHFAVAAAGSANSTHLPNGCLFLLWSRKYLANSFAVHKPVANDPAERYTFSLPRLLASVCIAAASAINFAIGPSFSDTQSSLSKGAIIFSPSPAQDPTGCPIGMHL